MKAYFCTIYSASTLLAAVTASHITFDAACSNQLSTDRLNKALDHALVLATNARDRLGEFLLPTPLWGAREWLFGADPEAWGYARAKYDRIASLKDGSATSAADIKIFCDTARFRESRMDEEGNFVIRRENTQEWASEYDIELCADGPGRNEAPLAGFVFGNSPITEIDTGATYWDVQLCPYTLKHIAQRPAITSLGDVEDWTPLIGYEAPPGRTDHRKTAADVPTGYLDALLLHELSHTVKTEDLVDAEGEPVYGWDRCIACGALNGKFEHTASNNADTYVMFAVVVAALNGGTRNPAGIAIQKDGSFKAM